MLLFLLFQPNLLFAEDYANDSVEDGNYDKHDGADDESQTGVHDEAADEDSILDVRLHYVFGVIEIGYVQRRPEGNRNARFHDRSDHIGESALERTCNQ